MMYNERDYLERCHSLVVFGGTFDPIHMGHIAIAQAACQQLKPQRVLFVPSGQSPHKNDRQIACAQHRYNMTALAICEYPSFDISRIEIDRPGFSYTIDTARTLLSLCPAGARFSFLIGDDAFKNILSWQDASELLRTCEFIVVPRPGHKNESISNKETLELIDYLAKNNNARIQRLNSPLLDISSTDIRERFKTGNTVHGLIPKTVEAYAYQHELYTPKTSTQAKFCYNTAQDTLRIRLSPKRFAHTMGVVATADELAKHYGQDREKARIAALLHDCAKEYSTGKKRALCKIWDIKLDAFLEDDIDLTHSLIGAESAKRDFYIHELEILQAIRYHTTGNSGMTMLDKIIMLADYIEPSHPNHGIVKEMRQLATTNINKALVLRIEHIISKKSKSGQPMHPWSLDALQELITTH